MRTFATLVLIAAIALAARTAAAPAGTGGAAPSPLPWAATRPLPPLETAPEGVLIAVGDVVLAGRQGVR